MDETDAARRARSALHEAGHLWAGFVLLGHVAPVVTIRPAASYLGACFLPLPVVDYSAADPSRPWATDPSITLEAHRHIVMLLAGTAAERLTWRRGDGWAADDDTPAACRKRAEAEAGALERFAPHDLALLDAAAAAPYLPAEIASDDLEAATIAAQLVGQSAGYLTLYLEQQAARFVERHAAALFELADALRAHTTMRGAEALSYVIPTERKENQLCPS